MKYTAIIFDMDGTIIDTEHIWRQATYCVIERRGITMTDACKEHLEPQLHGIGMKEACIVLKNYFALEDQLHDLVLEKTEIAKNLFKDHVAFMDGFAEFYAQVQHYNLKTAIATNADDQTLATTQQKLQLSQYFGDHVYGASIVQNRYKPDPALYLHAACQLEVDPQACIAIEDSIRGAQAAQAAGMFCIGLNSSNNPQLHKVTHMIVESYKEIDLKKLLF